MSRTNRPTAAELLYVWATARQKRLTGRAIAQALGMSEANVSRTLRGERHAAFKRVKKFVTSATTKANRSAA